MEWAQLCCLIYPHYKVANFLIFRDFIAKYAQSIIPWQLWDKYFLTCTYRVIKSSIQKFEDRKHSQQYFSPKMAKSQRREFDVKTPPLLNLVGGSQDLSQSCSKFTWLLLIYSHNFPPLFHLSIKKKIFSLLGSRHPSVQWRGRGCKEGQPVQHSAEWLQRCTGVQ